ncbi:MULTISPECIES: hypothetical protein [Streptomyces]|uniref:hypothetical protein n=1 Tax=Streptomyces TaxID=1883 RepID=UPI0004BE10A4|nr:MULTISPECIES: hypothetical protein [Streptomyces]
MTTWHYVLTIEIPEIGRSTAHDVIHVDDGTTRSQVYRIALKRTVDRLMRDFPDRNHYPPLTLFWSLDPETLD